MDSTVLPPPPKPKSLNVFGCINIAFGAIGLMSTVPSLIMMLSPEKHANNPVIQVMQKDATYAAFQKGIMVPGLLMVVAQLASGIGLVRAREWGRKLAIGWAVLSILVTPITAWMTMVHVHPVLIEQTMQQMGSRPISDAALTGMKVGIAASTVGMAALWIVYAIILIVMVSRAKVRAWCSARR